MLDKPALFSNARMTDKDIPASLYCYHLREKDSGIGFATVEPKVAVNHGGSVITKEPIDFGDAGYIAFTDDTSPNFLGIDATFDEFMQGDFGQTQTQEM